MRCELSNKFNKPSGNLQGIEYLFSLWKERENDVQPEEEAPSTYIKVQKKDVDQKVFLCAEESLKRLVQVAEHHGKYCQGKLKIKKMKHRGHVIATKFNCDQEQGSHAFLWSSSPYLPNKEYLINNRICHSFQCSGMLPSHYTRFVDGAGIGKIIQND